MCLTIAIDFVCYFYVKCNEIYTVYLSVCTFEEVCGL